MKSPDRGSLLSGLFMFRGGGKRQTMRGALGFAACFSKNFLPSKTD